MKTTDIKIKDRYVQGFEIPMGNATFVMIKAPRGYVACGYLNIASAEKFGDAAGIVRGVKNIDEALKAKIDDTTSFARKLGIKKGMVCSKAIEKLL